MLLTFLLGSLACTGSKSNDVAIVSDTDSPIDTASGHTGQPDTGTPVDTDDTAGTVDTAGNDDSADPSDTDDSGTSSEHVVLDFSLPDANPSSVSFGQPVSPRDYLNQVSGWYFIKAT